MTHRLSKVLFILVIITVTLGCQEEGSTGAEDLGSRILDAGPLSPDVADLGRFFDTLGPDAEPLDLSAPDAEIVPAVPTSTETVLFTTDEGTDQLLSIRTDPLAVAVQTDLQFSSNTISMVFDTHGVLYRTNGSTLVRLDPCNGSVEVVGEFGGNWYVPGLAITSKNTLFGISNNPGELVRINPSTGAAELVGPLGRRFGNTGLTWDERQQRLLAIDAADDGLYTIDSHTGNAELITRVGHDFDSVGIEADPRTGVLYACTGRDLLSIDTQTGAVELLGPIVTHGCNDLAVSWHDVRCPGD